MDYVNRMVDEFLKWRLPEDFSPDAGVVFTKPPNWHWWPTGTNLLTAVQARAMFEHCAESLLEDLARKDADCQSNGQRATELEAELARVREELAEMERRKDDAYMERNRCVALIAALAMRLGYKAGTARTAIEGWSDDWHGCVDIDLPSGQASWHYHDSQACLFSALPPYEQSWDGHCTDEKYLRISIEAHRTANEVERVARRAYWYGRGKHKDGKPFNADEAVAQAMREEG